MSVFVAIARARSLSAAGRQLAMPLSTVSRHLAALETHVGAPLVTRTTRHLSLTDAGRLYLEVCLRVMDDLDGVESQIDPRGKDLAGNLAITAPIVFGRLHVLPVLGEFLNAHPNVDAQLILDDRDIDLAREQIDLAVRIGHARSSSLIMTRVGTLRRLTVASPDYLARRGVPATPGDLADHDCVAFAIAERAPLWKFSSASGGQQSVRIKQRLTTNTAESAIDAAIAGLGVTRVLSYQADAALNAGTLQTLLEAHQDADVPVYGVHRPLKVQKPQAKAFLAFAAKKLRQRLSRLAH